MQGDRNTRAKTSKMVEELKKEVSNLIKILEKESLERILRRKEKEKIREEKERRDKEFWEGILNRFGGRKQNLKEKLECSENGDSSGAENKVDSCAEVKESIKERTPEKDVEPVVGSSDPNVDTTEGKMKDTSIVTRAEELKEDVNTEEMEDSKDEAMGVDASAKDKEDSPVEETNEENIDMTLYREEGEEDTTLEAAWETQQLTKLIFQRQNDSKTLKDTFMKLGDVPVESGHKTGMDGMEKCLELRTKCHGKFFFWGQPGQELSYLQFFLRSGEDCNIRLGWILTRRSGSARKRTKSGYVEGDAGVIELFFIYFVDVGS